MSISPSIVVASLPAVRIASESIKHALIKGVDFASQMAGSSKATPMEGNVATSVVSRSHKLDKLLPRLQSFLKSMEATHSSTIELRTDGNGRIEVDAASDVKQAVVHWMQTNSEWTEAWQNAAKEFLRGLPPRFPGDNLFQGEELSALSLRSRIDASSSEHFF